jgi:hypothetical protein
MPVSRRTQKKRNPKETRIVFKLVPPEKIRLIDYTSFSPFWGKTVISATKSSKAPEPRLQSKAAGAQSGFSKSAIMQQSDIFQSPNSNWVADDHLLFLTEDLIFFD